MEMEISNFNLTTILKYGQYVKYLKLQRLYNGLKICIGIPNAFQFLIH